MTGRQRRALATLVCLSLACVSHAGACELVMTEYRSGRALERIPLDPSQPVMEIAFTHSVLGTPVVDRYRWRAEGPGAYAELIEERFEGAGYGLPSAAGPGESLTREAAGWRLLLRRKVDPLVVRPLPSQRMRLLLAGRPELLLGGLTDQAILFQVQGCH